MRIKPERNHQRIRAERLDMVARRRKRCQEQLIPRPARQRQVQVRAPARPLAAFMGVAPVERIKTRGIGMDRDRQHIATPVEDPLRAVAVMHVDIKNGRPAPRRAQIVCRDGGVVQKAEAAGQILKGMMPRRTAKRVGRGFPRQKRIRRGQRGLRRPIGGGPCVCADGTGRVGLMITRKPHGRGRIAVRPRGGMDIRHDFGPRTVEPRPPRVDRLQEVQVGRIVDGRDGRHAVIFGRIEDAARSLRPVFEAARPFRLFR